MYQKLRSLTTDMVRPITVQGLRGRVLTHPSREPGRKRTIVFVYGIHGSLERFYGVIHYLARFGQVVVPDLPGLGGMEPFYKADRRPSLDAHGDYLAEFIARELPEGPITLIGLSYGFVVITRMLVRHPELVPRVELVISTMGLADGRDINLSEGVRLLGRGLFGLGQIRPLDRLSQYMLTRQWVLKLSYSGNNPKMKAIEPADRPEYIAFESYLWRVNDMRTYCACTGELFRLRQPGARVPIVVHHIATDHDHWLNVPLAEAHIREIYGELVVHRSALSNHGGTAYLDEAEAGEMIPASVTKLLEAAH